MSQGVPAALSPNPEPERLGLVRGSLLALGLLALAAVGYGFTVRDFYLSDDFGFLSRSLVAEDVLRGMDLRQPVPGMWVRPMSSGTWYLNAKLTPDFRDPLGHHLLNLGLHVLNAWLLAWLVLALRGSVASACLAAALFVAYPLHPEAVTWISGRVDVLCATGLLGALVAWTSWCRRGSRLALGACYAAFAFGMLSKEMAVTTPVLALVLGVFPLRAPRRRLLVGLAGFGVVGALYVGLRLWLLGGVGGYQDEGGSTVLSLDVGRAALFVWRSAEHFAAPLARAALPAGLGLARFLPLVVLAVGIAWCAAARERRPRLGYLALFALLCLLSMGPVATWAWLEDDFQSTRFLYIPSAFLLAGLVWVFPAVGGRAGYFGLAALLLAVQLVGLRHLNAEWHEAGRLSRLTLERLDERATGAKPGPLAVVGHPRLSGNAYVWHNGFNEAARLLTRWQGFILEVEEEDWDELRARPWEQHRPAFLRWDPATEQWRAP